MLKNLANCKPTEFLVQTNRIRKVAEKWLEKTDVLSIRRRKPNIPEGVSEEERARIINAQVKDNLSKMLTAILEDASAESLELLALLCFVEPQDVDSHEVSEYIESLSALISNRAVLGFFTSLVQLGQMSS